MKKPLLNVIFASEKRKNVLLLLKDGSKEMEFLLESLDTTRQALLPQVKVLEEYSLVNHYADTYDLTTIGKLIVNEMTPLLGTITVFDKDIDYWGTRNLDFIPPYLLEKMNDLRQCEVIRPTAIYIHDFNKTIIETSYKSEFQYMLCTFYHPDASQFFSKLMQNNTHVYFVITSELLDKLRTEYIAEFKELLKSKLFHFFVCSVKMDFLLVAYNNYHLLLRPLKSNGEFDNNHVLCSGPEALEWGKELFDHYLKESTPITKI